MERQDRPERVNNAFYDDLGESWYESSDHPIALLRAENRVRNPWIAEQIHRHFQKDVSVLDVGCGGGLLTNFLAKAGHRVVGVDLSEESLKIAKAHDKTESVQYLTADAAFLPFPRASFDVVCAMDILEHVESPERLVKEASFVLKPGGLFFFHTFNRNYMSYLFIIKAVEWFVANTPANLHVYSSFIKPQELASMCHKEGMQVELMRGLRPEFSWALCSLLFAKKIPDTLSFCFSKTLLTGYCGIAIKMGDCTYDTIDVERQARAHSWQRAKGAHEGAWI